MNHHKSTRNLSWVLDVTALRTTRNDLTLHVGRRLFQTGKTSQCLRCTCASSILFSLAVQLLNTMQNVG